MLQMQAPSSWPTKTVPGSLMPSGQTYNLGSGVFEAQPQDVGVLLGLGFIQLVTDSSAQLAWAENLPATGVVAGGYANATVTVDSTGRVTSAAAGTGIDTGSGTSNTSVKWASSNTITNGGFVDNGTTISATEALAVQSAPPSSAGAGGVAGTITYDGTHIYLCTASGTWLRTSMTTF